MYTKQLETIGLSSNAAAVYELLLEKGALPASRISRLSGVERSLTYVVLNDLLEKKLAFKDTEKAVTRFAAAHPTELEKLVNAKQQASESAQSAFSAVIHQLQQQYEVQSGQPGVRFFDGATGLAYINKQMLIVDISEMLLIRTIKSSRDVPEYESLIKAQQALRIKRGITLKVITPSIDSVAEKIKTDKENLTERRIIAKEVLDTESQILIYGNTVAITTFSDPTITTVIENPAIAATLTSMFTYMWRMSVKETQDFVKKYQG